MVNTYNIKGVNFNPFPIVFKHILLDVHGVLTDGKERERFIAHMKKAYGMNTQEHNSLWVNNIDALDKKIKKESDYLKNINKTFNTNISVKEYYRIFLRYIKINKTLINKLEKIKNYQICIVSDNTPEISKGLPTIFGLSFKKYRKFFSFQLGMTKRERMLSAVVEALHAKPQECLFIDDSSKNIAVAKELGINSILFKNNKELFNEWKNYLITSNISSAYNTNSHI